MDKVGMDFTFSASISYPRWLDCDVLGGRVRRVIPGPQRLGPGTTQSTGSNPSNPLRWIWVACGLLCLFAAGRKGRAARKCESSILHALCTLHLSFYQHLPIARVGKLSIKGQRVNVSGCVGCLVCATNTQLCRGRGRWSYMNGMVVFQ